MEEKLFFCSEMLAFSMGQTIGTVSTEKTLFIKNDLAGP